MSAGPTMPTHIHGVPTEELKQGAINTLRWAALEMERDTIDFKLALSHADAAAACLWSLANAIKTKP